MKIYFNEFKKWEFNYLEIFDIKEKNSLYYYFKFLSSKQFKKLDGDVIEEIEKIHQQNPNPAP